MISVHVTPGPTVEVIRRPSRARWCFGCRACVPHAFVVLDYAEPSYFTPVALWECARCGRDRTRFPS